MKNKPNSDLDQNLLVRFFANETNESENKAIYEWIQVSEQNKAVFLKQKAIWDHASIKWTDIIDLEKEFAALREKVKSTQPGGKFGYNRKLLIYRLSSVAAVLMILFAIGWLGRVIWMKNSPENSKDNLTEIMIPKGQRGHITMADGTGVWINADSRLRYPTQFNEKTREVFLEGEAFFEVAHDKQKPFLVHTTTIDVKVLGTRFNISSYTNDLKTETTVAEGCVSIRGKENLKNREGLQGEIKLLPNNKAVLNKGDDNFELEKVNVEMATAWKDGTICFDEKSLNEIARMIERQFDVEIVIENPLIKDNIYTATFEKGKTVEDILYALKRSSNFDYKISGRKITIQ
jgi:transmembrane sensor